jgi:ElaB/YqjD/DUF883 family membrane-anchored ribosome-binding protein
MKNIKNWMMVLVLGTMVSGLAHAEELQEYPSENQVVESSNGKKRLFDKSRLIKMKKKVKEWGNKATEKFKTMDRRRLKEMKEKLQLLKYNIPGIFEAFKDKVKNGKLSDGLKEMRSKIESTLENLKTNGLINQERFDKMKSKLNSMAEKLKEKMGRSKSDEHVVPQEFLNEVTEVQNLFKAYIKELHSSLDAEINSNQNS